MTLQTFAHSPEGDVADEAERAPVWGVRAGLNTTSIAVAPSSIQSAPAGRSWQIRPTFPSQGCMSEEDIRGDFAPVTLAIGAIIELRPVRDVTSRFGEVAGDRGHDVVDRLHDAVRT
ncbi:hypothetical protein ACTJJ8_09475 [Agrobacterium radiobacter]|uniref:hypothetical protein n=1 Tax=Agrobacterium tumefaciens complex TaxID=1183400 RepID=UPI0007675EC6|nr:hypothetical protein [Agrobacterium tumefaciens]AMD56920.1 hypothetical protein AWN88_01175 [Agrobacterium tumefaciens]UNZ52535.1 hypothetical protein MLE07_17215 [Agrobacterium tumefaciens]